MPESTLIHSTFVIEKTFAKSPQKVFAAFADPATKRRWFAEGDSHEVEAYALDFRIDGVETWRTLFKPGTPIAGMTITQTTTYLDIVPDRSIVTSSRMMLNDRPMSATLVTFEFIANGAGTDMVCTHQGVFFEHSDGPERREGGWRFMFDRLAAVLGE